ncbi:MAG TPA: hypothetical protein VK674_03205 [Candidatus Limnocylindria bacterium]|nr:hypothetical protein [Candidatus Limnocylindria bacterium]
MTGNGLGEFATPGWEDWLHDALPLAGGFRRFEGASLLPDLLRLAREVQADQEVKAVEGVSTAGEKLARGLARMTEGLRGGYQNLAGPGQSCVVVGHDLWEDHSRDMIDTIHELQEGGVHVVGGIVAFGSAASGLVAKATGVEVASLYPE